ncbi:hypothetical protein RGCCGE502_21360 [Rhizobium grahamii CCGE 502]|uniref:Uncharacterized protein n=1 Tax=Rhizobium grahamii CCGE 502 TaxID=990285 RepID=S3HSI5_9HYPH|nr:hypothetical protein RGCCGE502_21360 [Rhizobium grahamii CCGE 502]
MATIGTFTSSENGFSGSIRTLALNVKAPHFPALRTLPTKARNSGYMPAMSPERTDIIQSSSCNAAPFAIGSMQEYKLPSVVFTTVPVIVRRSLSCRRLWSWPSARQCPRYMQPLRRTAGEMNLSSMMC